MAIVRTWVAVVVALILMHIRAEAQAPSLGFPIAIAGQSQNPYTAPIVTVLDHSTDSFYDPKQTSVLAYTGEMGKDRCSPSGISLSLGKPCGYYNSSFVPRDDTDTREFIVNGSYKGDSADCVTPSCLDQTKVLNYRGHSGYDYGFGPNTVIVAAQSGTLYIPAADSINDAGGTDPWCDLHTFYIDHGNGWTTWYLHADHLTVGVQPPHACPVTQPLASDQRIAQVQKGQPIAIVGNFANGAPGGVGFHLHFEVRRGCDLSSGAIFNCMVVDPYGWEWSTADSISNVLCTKGGSKHCATYQATPLWNLPDWNVRQPLVSSISLAPSASGITATIIGQNFDPGALVTLWDRQGQYHVANFTPTSLTSTQIIAQLPNPPVSDPGFFLLKVRNLQGPRSTAATMFVPAATASVPLVLNGRPAPGGGTFAGFAGFLSANDRGEATFSAGIDLNGDGAPDTFADFELSNGQMVKMTVPGFTNISSVVTHARINNRGDIAFGDVNGTLGASPAGIYVLRAGSPVPTQIALSGGACPIPCPVAGSPTLSQLTGPLAINDAGDVTFATSLLNGQTHATTCCYLFLYSGADGSVIKVAADGVSGDPAPGGGFFTQGALLPPINHITSDGDVVFLSTVTGTPSQGGIFRFSRLSRQLSRVVVQGDPVPAPVGGVFGFPLMGAAGAVSKRELVFHAPVAGVTSGQVVAVIKDLTQTGSANVALVAIQGQPTGTIAGGSFSNPFATTGPNLPFGGFGQNTAPPWVRSDGAVIFQSLLVGAQSLGGTSTTEGLFLWNGVGFQKLVVNGDPAAGGAHVQGISATAINNVGGVFYFAASIQ